MNNKVKLLHGGNNPSISKNALRQMQEDLPILVAFLQENAGLIKAKYDALIEQKFTEQQALELCKGPLYNFG